MYHVIGMKEMNASNCEIREVIGRNHGSIQRFYHKYEQTGNINRKIGSVKHMKLNDHDVRNIKYIARRDPFITYNQIKVDLNLEYVCPRTMVRSLSITIL